MPVALRASGDLRVGVLMGGLSEVVRRQEALRTVFPQVEGEPFQEIRPPFEVSLPVVDLSGLPALVQQEEAYALIGNRRAAASTFPVVHCCVERSCASEHPITFFCLPCITSSATAGRWRSRCARSWRLLRAGCRSAPGVAAASCPTRGLCSAAEERLHGEVLEKQIAYWRAQLARSSPSAGASCRSSSPGCAELPGRESSDHLEPELCMRLRVLARQEGGTLFMVVLAGFQALLSRLSGQDDLAVGTPVAGRNHLEIEGLIGFSSTRWCCGLI